MGIVDDDIMIGGNIPSEHGETLDYLTSDRYLNKKTIFYSFDQAYAYAVLNSIAKQNDISLLKNFLREFAESSISVDAQGRKDIVNVSQYRGSSNIGVTEKFLERFEKNK